MIVDSGTGHGHLPLAASFSIYTVLRMYHEHAFVLGKGKELWHRLQQPGSDVKPYLVLVGGKLKPVSCIVGREGASGISSLFI